MSTKFHQLLGKFPSVGLLNTILEALNDENLKVGLYRYKNIYSVYVQRMDTLGPRIIREYSVTQVNKMLLDTDTLTREIEAMINHFKIELEIEKRNRKG